MRIRVYAGKTMDIPDVSLGDGMGAIYRLWFPSINKGYIGQTTNIATRMSHHFGPEGRFGKLRHEVEINILTIAPIQNLNQLEEATIKEYNTLYPNGLNMTPDGQFAILESDAHKESSIYREDKANYMTREEVKQGMHAEPTDTTLIPNNKGAKSISFIQDVVLKGSGHCIPIPPEIHHVLNPKDGEFFQITIQRIDMIDLE